MATFFAALASRLGWALLLPGLLLTTWAARAQAPGWGGVAAGTTAQSVNTSVITGVAADGRGNVFVTGNFTGTVAFGSTVLTSGGGDDLFVAKYVPATSTWAWAQSGGGTGTDLGYGVAVSGSSVYVVGVFYNDLANTQGVRLGGTSPATSTSQVNGATATTSNDLLLAKYTDNGLTATLGWTQVGGGTGDDYANGVAASGSSVYVVGSISNTSLNSRGVVLGGGGTTAGTRPQYGVSTTASFDVLLAKYTDNGATATLGWSQVGGGNQTDFGQGVAVSGSSVYVTGNITNSAANADNVLFGGSGTAPGTTQVNGVIGRSAYALLLAKYTDNGATATLGWTQVGGGTGFTSGNGVAASGGSVYVAGYLYNNTANSATTTFGGGGTTPGTSVINGATATSSTDLLLAKYTDQGPTGRYVWSQVAGGTGFDQGTGVAVSGTSVFVTGYLQNSAANASAAVFGGGGTTTGTAPQAGTSSGNTLDVLLAKYTDNGLTGSYNWSQVGGGGDSDFGYGVAISGQQVYTGGRVQLPAAFGATTLAGPSFTTLAVLPRLTDATLAPLAARAGSAAPALALWPNPTTGRTTLGGAAPGTTVQVLDALGRLLLTTTADATGTAPLPLPARLPGGVYLVRSGSQVARLVVE